MSMVHSSQGQNKPASEQLRSEVAIIAGIATATLGDNPIPWTKLADDYSLIRDDIAAVLPEFKNYNVLIESDRGFYLKNSAATRQWRTPEKKAVFSASILPVQLTHEKILSSASTAVLTLQTMRSHDQYNTSIYAMDDRYRGIYGERKVLFANSEDMAKQHLKNGDLVTIKTVSNDNIKRSISGFKIVYYQIPAGCVAAYYPETNPLVPLDSIAEDCGTPTYKSIPVMLEKLS